MKRVKIIVLLVFAVAAVAILASLMLRSSDGFFKGDYFGVTWDMSAEEVLRVFPGRVVEDIQKSLEARVLTFEHEDNGFMTRTIFLFDHAGRLEEIGVEPGDVPAVYAFKMLEKFGRDTDGLSEEAALAMVGRLNEEMRAGGDAARWREVWNEVFAPQIKAFQIYSTRYTNRLVRKYGEWERKIPHDGTEFSTTMVQWQTPETAIYVVMGVNWLRAHYFPERE
jgi:hypothetical protein